MCSTEKQLKRRQGDDTITLSFYHGGTERRMKKLAIPVLNLMLILILCGCGYFTSTADPTVSVSSHTAEETGKEEAETADYEALSEDTDTREETGKNTDPESNEEAAEIPAATPVPVATPKPIPELLFPNGSTHKILERRLNCSWLMHTEVKLLIPLLQQMPKLRFVNLGEEGTEENPREFGWEDVRALQDACPDTDFRYGFSLFGQYFTTLDEEMNFHHVTMEDEGDAIREVLPCMKKCRLLDMDFSGVSSESMAQIRDDYPNMKVVWRIWFGTNCSVRTDVERILASNLDHKLTDDNSGDLKYCTGVRLLDIGHNELLTDFSFLHYMPELEVAILGISGMRDFWDLSDCTKLEYLELNTLYWGQNPDLTPLKNLKNLEHLNLCRLGEVEHWEVLKDLTKLKRLYFGCYTHVPEGAREELEAALPNTEIDWKTPTGCDDGWRFDGHGGYAERYALLRKQFEYSNYTNVSSAWYNDPMYYKEGEPHYRPSNWW